MAHIGGTTQRSPWRANNTRTSRSRKRPTSSQTILNDAIYNPFTISYIH